MDQKGLLLCARYSVAPNFFGYCGPPENSSLIDHLREEIGDKEVHHILSQFDTLFLNLRLIAFSNKIKDPFDYQVVEAYWIGNNLLENIEGESYAVLLEEKFALPKKIGRNSFGRLKYKVLSNHVLPHHSFHVFNIFKRTGADQSFHTLETMDNCRIGFGQIVCCVQQKKLKFESNKIIVYYRPITLFNNRLQFGHLVNKDLKVDYKGKSFLKNLKVGDWVSFHWGFVCDILTVRQVKSLEFYTQKAIDFYNL